jgi:DNA-binding CsgD family transcriptional regulator
MIRNSGAQRITLDVDGRALAGTGGVMSESYTASAGFPADRLEGIRRAMSRESLVTRLARMNDDPSISAPFSLLTDYCGASAYLIARYDMVSDQRLDNVLTSNWPFDLVRQIDDELHVGYHRSNEFEKCLSVLQPAFAAFPDDAVLPPAISRQYCSLIFNAGRTRYILLFLLPDNTAHSSHRLMEAGLLAAYILSMRAGRKVQMDRDMDLTERELECIYWIAEGKTSDEIAMILGISKNTINNYITSVMRKTATKNRSEAIAYAVRNNLV